MSLFLLRRLQAHGPSRKDQQWEKMATGMHISLGLPAVWILAFAAVTSRSQGQAQDFTLPKVFHITGIPELRRNARGDLALTQKALIFQQSKKSLLELPYQRIRRVQIISGHRYHGKSTVVAAGVDPTGLGSLLILKKRKVDTLALDFVNDRGGLMGLVLQVPENDGARCKQWLVRFGVTVEEPVAPPPKE